MALSANPHCTNRLCKTQLKPHQKNLLSSSRINSPECHVKLQRTFLLPTRTTKIRPNVPKHKNEAQELRRELGQIEAVTYKVRPQLGQVIDRPKLTLPPLSPKIGQFGQPPEKRPKPLQSQFGQNSDHNSARNKCHVKLQGFVTRFWGCHGGFLPPLFSCKNLSSAWRVFYLYPLRRGMKGSTASKQSCRLNRLYSP